MKINIYKLIIFAFGFILYANTLSHRYTLDDKAVIWNNSFTQKGIAGIKDILSYDSFAGMFGKDSNLEGGRYRPLSIVTFALEIEFFGKETTDKSARESFIGNPFVSHLVNVLLYCCCLLILFKVLKKLFVNFKAKYEFLSIPFIATLLFAVYPLHTEIVANIKGRDEIMAFLFSFLALNSIINYFDKNKSGQLVLAFIYMFLGSMSKEIAITFLAVIPLSIYFFAKKQKISKYITALIPLCAGVILYLIVRHLAIGNQMGIEITNLMNNPFYEMTVSQRYATIIFTLLLYLKLLIFPYPLTWDYYPYHISILEWSNIWVIISIIIHLALIVIAVLGFKKKTVLSYSIIIYAATLSITSNLFFNIGAFMSERFLFVSLLGLCIFVAYLISEKLPKLFKNIKNYKIISINIILVVLVLFSIKTISRNRVWKDNLTLFEHDLNISKNSAKGNSTYASELYKLSEDVEQEAKKAGEQGDTVLMNNLLEIRNEYLLKSKPYFEKAIEIYPYYEEALVSLGNLHYRMYDNYEIMFKYYIQALEYNKLNKDVWENTIGVLTYNLNDREYKKQIWSKYSELSDYYESFFQLGNLYCSDNPPQNDSAIYYFEKAKAYKCNYFDLFFNLAISYGNTGNFEKARDNLFLASKIKQDVNVFRFIGISYGIENNHEKAAEYFEKALQIEPNNQEIRNFLLIEKSKM